MDKNTLITLDMDLINNAATRMPVCLCVDVSDSMNYVIDDSVTTETGETGIDDEGNPYVVVRGGVTKMQKLIEGLITFKSQLMKDVIARSSAEICIVAFSDNAVCLSDFCSADKFEVPEFETSGSTDMGAGVNLALDKLEERKNMYKEVGIDYYQPMLVIFSDGGANGNKAVFNAASRRACDMVNNRKLTSLPIVICKKNDEKEVNNAYESLKSFSPKNKPKKLDAIKFTDFFEWLSKSVSIRSRSQPEDRVVAPSTDVWEL